MNKILLGLAIGALVCVILFTRFSCQPNEPVKLVNMDSLSKAYQQERDSIAVNQFALEREIAVLEELRRLDQEALNRANTTLTESNQKVRSLIAANRELKAANDTLGLVSNCNDLVVDAYNLTVAVDSLQTALAVSEETTRGLIEMQDAAIEAANDAALKSHEFAMKMRAAVEQCNTDAIKLQKLPARQKKKAFANGLLFGIAGGIITGFIISK